jgi:hypothetical protein
VLQANLSDNSVGGFEALRAQLIWKEGPERSGDVMRPWSVVWSLQEGPAS